MSQPYNLIQVIPYVLVLIGGVVGINVFLVLLIGIGSGALIMLIWRLCGACGNAHTYGKWCFWNV